MDEVGKLLATFERYLRSADEKDAETSLEPVLDVLARRAEWAVIWRRVLFAAAHGSEAIRNRLLPLLWSVPVLACGDTAQAVAEGLPAAYAALTENQRIWVEQAILAVPDCETIGSRESRELRRDRLLGALPQGAMVTDETRRRLEELRASGGAPLYPEGPRVNFVLGPGGSETDHLAEQGVPVHDEPNQRLRVLCEPVSTFVVAFRGDQHPPEGEVAAVIPALRSLYSALRSGAIEGAYPLQVYAIWNQLVQACGIIARVPDTDCNTEIGSLVHDVLLHAYRSGPADPRERDIPAPDAPHPSWNDDWVLAHVATGIMLLAGHSSCIDAEVTEIVAALASDDHPAIRYIVATHLAPLLEANPPAGFHVVVRRCKEEEHPWAIAALLADPLRHLVRTQASETLSLLTTVANRLGQEEEWTVAWDALGDNLAAGFVLHGADAYLQLLCSVTGEGAQREHVAGRAMWRSGKFIEWGYAHREEDAERARAYRVRGWQVLDRFLQPALTEFDALQRRLSGVSTAQWSDADREQYQVVARTSDHVSTTLHLSSGAFQPDRHDRPIVAEKLEQAQLCLTEASGILEGLCDVPFPNVTHNLVETLVYLAPGDPAKVFRWITKAVLAGSTMGYQLEGQAWSLIVPAIEWYLADYRQLFADNFECREDLVRLLDVFVEAGWPGAWSLTYRLEEIFR